MPNKRIDIADLARVLVDIGQEVTAVRELIDETTSGGLGSDTLLVTGLLVTQSTLTHVDAALDLIGHSQSGGFSDAFKEANATTRGQP